ncbi:MAG: Vms1/Ankzf1 family peptidyl-tRNA hydrolase [Dehalococcoidales bacterium]
MKKYVLSRTKTLALLDYLAGSSGDTDQTLYLPPRLSPTKLENIIKDVNISSKVSDELIKVYTASPTGVAIYRAGGQIRLVIPPFPLKEITIFATAETAPLRSLLERDYLIGLVLVRLGSYAIGVCRGDKLVSSKVGTGLVHGRHRQGGSSSHRFERHRDKQIESFLIRVCGHIREQFEPYVKLMDYIVYGGARTTILTAQKYCPWLEKLDKPTLPPLLDIPEPRLPVLQAAVSRIWSSTLYDFSED